MKRLQVGIVLLVVLGAGLWWVTSRASSAEGSLPPLHTEVVNRGDVSQRITAFGSLQPVQRVEVGSQVSGIIDEIMVDFNSPVRRGQVIAQIDPSTFRAAVSSAEAELASAEAGLELARHQWERTQELRALQFVSPSDVDQARASLSQAEAQVQVRRHALDAAVRELERSTITAPSHGIVISRSVDVGQTVAASLSAPVLFESASDLSQMHIHASVSEADIGEVAEGQQVRFLVDAHRGREFVGEVIQVRNAPVMQDNVVHYETIIAVDNEEGLLKPGMTAEVRIITDEVRDVLRVRNTALRARLPDNIRPPDPPSSGADSDAPGTAGRVYVVLNGGLQAVAVRTGLTDGAYTEILSGLEEGDVVAVGLSLAGEESNGGRSLLTGSQATF
ncbi:MAG: efflux RND transporter periplasmic adaptor subunit [Gemmatimonadales bacterium]|nr:MAG: efflux RND transporter periplasmic adaptor subunit [Gemmatimonadales bacterium]